MLKLDCIIKKSILMFLIIYKTKVKMEYILGQ